MKKGQAAMEFLMTYGWAILIVLAAIGALAYFGVLSPNKLLPERTVFQAPLPNVDNAVITTDGTDTTFAIAFKNNKGVEVDVVATPAGEEAVTFESPAGTTCTASANAAVADIGNGDNFVVTWTCPGATGDSGERLKANLKFYYTNAETGQTIPHAGSVDGKWS